MFASNLLANNILKRHIAVGMLVVRSFFDATLHLQLKHLFIGVCQKSKGTDRVAEDTHMLLPLS